MLNIEANARFLYVSGDGDNAVAVLLITIIVPAVVTIPTYFYYTQK